MVNNYQSMQDMLIDRFQKSKNKPFLTLVDCEEEFSFGDIAKMTWNAIDYMEIRDISNGDNVVLMLNNTKELIVMIFACLITGIKFILLDPDSKSDETAQFNNILKIKAIFIDTGMPKDVEQPSGTPCYIINNNTFVSANNKIDFDFDVLKHKVLPEDIAYIMCSSGSTGKPKRICISQANIVNELEAMAKAYQLENSDLHMCVLPLYHASGLFRNILMPFYQGTSVVLARNFNIENFWDVIEKHKVNFVQLVPSVLSLLLSNEKNPSNNAQSHLKYIGTASAPLPLQIKEDFEKRFGIKVVQGYGLTESTCGITLNDIDNNNSPRSVGRALNVNDIEIIGDIGELLPANTVGEVAIKGKNVMLGYLDDEGKLVNQDNDSWFYTNDLGYLDEEGYLYLSGRKSDIVNRGAHKVSPVEVEDVIIRYPNILDVVVVPVEHTILGEDIIACIKVTSDYKDTSSTVINYISKQLPSYKIPSVVYVVDDIPRSSSGKINRKEFKETLNLSNISNINNRNIKLDEEEITNVIKSLINELFNLSDNNKYYDHENIKEWDSMGHIRLILAIEDSYGIKISPLESSNIKNINDITSIIILHLSDNENKCRIELI